MATALEVEAATKAARLVIRPDDLALPQPWQVGRYAWATSNFGYGSIGSAAVLNGQHMLFSWINVGGIAVIKKIYGFIVVGARGSSATSGDVQMKLFRAYGLGPWVNQSNANFPPPQGGGGLGGHSPTTVGTSGLQANQPPSQAHIQGGLLTTAIVTGYLDALPISAIESACPVTAGVTLLSNAPLYDWMGGGEQPLILTPGTGVYVTISLPALSTISASTPMYFVNMQWDEWTLREGDL